LRGEKKMTLKQYEKHMNALKHNAEYYVSMIKYYDEAKNEGSKADYRDKYLGAQKSASGYIEAIRSIYGDKTGDKLERYYYEIINELQIK
jgi:hypothetical protein